VLNTALGEFEATPTMEDILLRVVNLNPGLNMAEINVRRLETGEYVVIPVANSDIYIGMVGITFTIKE